MERLVRISQINRCGSAGQVDRDALLLLDHRHGGILPRWHFAGVVLYNLDQLDTLADLVADLLNRYDEPQAIERLRRLPEFQQMHADAVAFNSSLTTSGK